MYDYDVIIIGGGVSGAASARELSRYKVKACVLEKEGDVCCGTSKANSAIVHAGFDAATGTVMAKLNVRGNEMMEGLCEELDIPFLRNGSLVICLSEEDMPGLKALYDRGIANGVKELRILTKEEVLEMEPNISEHVYAALYAPTGGIICPFTLNIAFAENAYENGIDFHFNTEVLDIVKLKEGYELHTSRGIYFAKAVINAAGVYSDIFHNMVSKKKIHITPRKGEYFLLDKNVGNHVKKTIFALPGRLGKGVLVSPTIHGNLLLGPTAMDIEDREGTNTTGKGLGELLDKAGMNVKNLPLRQVITSFAGLRAHEEHHEFIIGEVEDAPGFVDCAGIESPGLTSCPAIGEMVADIVKEKLTLVKKENFVAERKDILHPRELPEEEMATLIREKPAYGNIICRCEMITEGEIIDAVKRPLGAKDLDGVKRRTRAGAGRCQAGFCSPRVMEILARELDMEISDVTKFGRDSRLILGRNKDMLKKEASISESELLRNDYQKEKILLGRRQDG